MTVLLILGLILLALIGAPLFMVLTGAALLGYSTMAEPPTDDIHGYLMVHMFRLSETSVLIALPLFTFAGYLLSESKAPTRLVRFSRALVGWVPGGLAFVTLVTCSIFTAFSGATGVTVIALGGLLLPALLKDGYREKFSLGLLTTSGSMGLLLPPSLALILYGIVAANNLQSVDIGGTDYYEILELEETAGQEQIKSVYQERLKEIKALIADGDEDAEWDLDELKEAYAAIGSPKNREMYDEKRKIKLETVSVDNLFIAGILPSLVMLILLAGYSVIRAAGEMQETVSFSGAEVWKAFRGAIWEVPIPVLILGGIYGGFFTVTDAAAVTAFYVLIIEVFIYRDIHIFRDLPRVTLDSMVLIGGILLILMCAMAFTGYLIDQDVPAKVMKWIETYVDSRIGFLLMLNLCLLVVGVMMDIFSATVVVVPLILPLALKFGVHPVHLGIIFLTNLQIGFLTPPVGLGLFLSSSRFEKPVLEIFRATLPFLLLLIVALVIITYVPWLSMVLIGG